MSATTFLSARRRDWQDFRLLWGGQSVSLVGDQVFLLALPLAALRELHAGTMQVALLAALSRLPFLLLGLPAGVWVARLGLRRSMLGADLVRSAAVLSLPLAAWLDFLAPAQLFAVALVTGTAMVFFQVAYQSYTPALIADDRRLHAANTRLSLSESTALLIGPGLAGVVISAVGATRALLLDAGSYAVSVLTLTAIRHRETIVPARQPMWHDVRDGLRFVARHPVLRPIMMCSAAYNLGVAMYDALLAVFAVQHLHLSAWAFGTALAVGGAGFPLGGLLARRTAARVGLGPSLAVAALPSIAGLAIGASAHGHQAAALLAAGTFVNGVGQGLFAVNALTLRHLAAPPELTTRATAVHRFVTWGMLPLGSVLAGLVGGAFGVRAAMLAAAATTAFCLPPLLARPLLSARRPQRQTALG
ncbi:MFS transporter [Actinomadura parmotrematis]|uniref:MFS transporter n=1 Tax=Actinomadura parmotrematis TaxID=2864039 RepID=A0ABS7G1A7_9ACTN|nr:MFS transporter [Actinomadura parmotrematis]MBW8486331.1 MFS transporter [Actinomadura parmotrematis]